MDGSDRTQGSRRNYLPMSNLLRSELWVVRWCSLRCLVISDRDQLHIHSSRPWISMGISRIPANIQYGISSTPSGIHYLSPQGDSSSRWRRRIARLGHQWGWIWLFKPVHYYFDRYLMIGLYTLVFVSLNTEYIQKKGKTWILCSSLAVLVPHTCSLQNLTYLTLYYF